MRPHSDPGLQPERTVLAWTRTMLALMVVSLLCLRWSATHGPLLIGLFVFLILVSLAIFLQLPRRYRRSSDSLTAQSHSSVLVANLLLALAVNVTALVGMILVLS